VHSENYSTKTLMPKVKVLCQFFEAVDHPGFQERGWDAESVFRMWCNADENRQKLLEQFCAVDGSGHQILPNHCVCLLEAHCMNDPEIKKAFAMNIDEFKKMKTSRGRLVCGSVKVARSAFGYFWRKLFVTEKWRYLGNGHTYGSGSPMLSTEVDNFIKVRRLPAVLTDHNGL
jgi:hypothetical protein